MKEKIVDRIKLDDKCSGKYVVGMIAEKIVNDLTGEIMFKPVEFNDTLIGGTQLTAMKMFLLEDAEVTAKIRKIRISELDSDPYFAVSGKLANIVPGSLAPQQGIFGFSLALDGAHSAQVKAVPRFDKGFKADGIIPMIELPIAMDDPQKYMEKYAFRVERMINGNKYAQYYIKKFNYVEFKNQDTTGNDLRDYPELYMKDTKIDVETVVEMDLNITTEDMRSYFQRTSNAMDRFFNAVILWAGKKCMVDVKLDNALTYKLTDYRNIIATNRTHRKDLPLERGGKIVSYTYLLYYI